MFMSILYSPSDYNMNMTIYIFIYYVVSQKELDIFSVLTTHYRTYPPTTPFSCETIVSQKPSRAATGRNYKFKNKDAIAVII